MIKRELSKGCKKLLRKLYKNRIIGGKHLPEVLCLKQISHLPKQEQKVIIKDWEWCIKEGLVLTKPKPGERHVFLNPERLQEIIRIINEGEKENG